MKRNSLDERRTKIEPETHPDVVVIMEKFVLKFKGVHINKVLDIQGKSFKDLHKLNGHLDSRGD